MYYKELDTCNHYNWNIYIIFDSSNAMFNTFLMVNLIWLRFKFSLVLFGLDYHVIGQRIIIPI